MAKKRNPDQFDFFGLLPKSQRPMGETPVYLQRKTPKALRKQISKTNPEWSIAHEITLDSKFGGGSPRRPKFWEKSPSRSDRTQTSTGRTADQPPLFSGNVGTRLNFCSWRFALPGPDIEKSDAKKLADAFPEFIQKKKRAQ